MVELNGKLSRDVVIVGASLAGLRAAETVARVAPELTVTVVGEEAHRPYDRPPLSKRALTEPLDIDAVPSARTRGFATTVWNSSSVPER